MLFLAFVIGFICGVGWVASGILVRAAKRCCRCRARIWCWHLECRSSAHRCEPCWAEHERLTGGEAEAETKAGG